MTTSIQGHKLHYAHMPRTSHNSGCPPRGLTPALSPWGEQAIRLWGRLERLKHIVMEPRGGGSEGLQKVMETYYHAIATGRGGLFMAVCRGKVRRMLCLGAAAPV